MEAAVVSVSTGVIKPLLSKLTKLLADEYLKLKGVRKQIKFLIDEMSAMSSTIEMLADEEQLSPEMKDWRDKLREMAYDIEDCIDAFMARGDHDGSKGFRGFVRKMKNLKVRHKIGKEIEELKRRIIDASERHKRYNFLRSAHNSSTSSIDPRLSALYEDIGNLVAIDGPKKHIIELLNIEMKGSSTDVKVVSIYGCGGLGKTTLANQVYRSIKSHYTCSAFVSVSQNPNYIKILRDIAKGVGITTFALDDDVQQLIDKLREYLDHKSYFIVIDDIWEAKDWEPIKLALLNNNCGSRIITTSRSTTVATISSADGGNAYEMKPLSFDDAKKLFFKRAYGSENSWYPYLEDVSDRILRKCGGLPLVIITVASMLAGQHAKEKWDSVLNAIGCKLAKRPGAERMTSILSLSYTSMPQHLRTCLLYLSLFPEDYIIPKQCLINRWIAEGFIQKEQGICAYETGESYFNELINRCMIQPVNVKYDQAKACHVHDIILDYIKCMAAEENFIALLDASESVYTSEYKARRLYVEKYSEKNGTICAGLTLSHVRSLTIVGQCVETFEPFMALRVLDLQHCWQIEDRHLASIGKLFYLKYLQLDSWSITKLPEKIGELKYLHTLDVRGTRIGELPTTITKLQQLANLYVGWGTTFPDGIIGQMHSLEVLRKYAIKSFKQGTELSKLTKLRTLKIRWDFDLPDGSEGIRQFEEILGILLSSGNLHNLSISISGYSDKLCPLSLDSWHSAVPYSLKTFCFKNGAMYKTLNWMRFLGNLQVLQLGILCVRPEDVDILGVMPTLFFLKLETIGGSNGSIIVRGKNRFRSLIFFSLRISHCGTSLEFEAGAMPKLEHLELALSVHDMKCLNGISNLGIQHLYALSKVKIKIQGDCDSKPNYDPTNDTDFRAYKCVASAISAAVDTLPNRPSLSFNTSYDPGGCFFEHFLRKYNLKNGGLLTEWLKFWHIEEKAEDQMRRHSKRPLHLRRLRSANPFSPSISSSFPSWHFRQDETLI